MTIADCFHLRIPKSWVRDLGPRSQTLATIYAISKKTGKFMATPPFIAGRLNLPARSVEKHRQFLIKSGYLVERHRTTRRRILELRIEPDPNEHFFFLPREFLLKMQNFTDRILAAYFLQLQKSQPERGSVGIEIDRMQIRHQTGFSRPTINKSIARLNDFQVIESGDDGKFLMYDAWEFLL